MTGTILRPSQQTPEQKSRKGLARTESSSVRFWRKVDKNGPNGCWEWTAALKSSGYPNFWDGTRNVPGHRFSYELLVGPIPEGLNIDHLCRNPLCVNPAHLEPVTQRENVLRGVGFAATNAQMTHCIRGHEFTPENTYVTAKGQRHCRACGALRARVYKRRRKERV